MSKHTPAPWTVAKMTPTYQIPIYGENPDGFAKNKRKWICSVDAGEDAAAAQANARLIAAAPDLLEACKLALKRFSLLRALFTPNANATNRIPVYCPALNMEDIEPYDMNVVDTLTVAIEKVLT